MKKIMALLLLQSCMTLVTANDQGIKLGSNPATWAPATSAEDVLEKLRAHRQALFEKYEDFKKDESLRQRFYEAIRAEYANEKERYFENLVRSFLGIDPSVSYLAEVDIKKVFPKDKVNTLDELLTALADARKSIIDHYSAKTARRIDWNELYKTLADDVKTQDWLNKNLAKAKSEQA